MHFVTCIALPFLSAVMPDELNVPNRTFEISSSDCIVPAGAEAGVREPADVSLKTPKIRATLIAIINADLTNFFGVDASAVMSISILPARPTTK